MRPLHMPAFRSHPAKTSLPVNQPLFSGTTVNDTVRLSGDTADTRLPSARLLHALRMLTRGDMGEAIHALGEAQEIIKGIRQMPPGRERDQVIETLALANESFEIGTHAPRSLETSYEAAGRLNLHTSQAKRNELAAKLLLDVMSGFGGDHNVVSALFENLSDDDIKAQRILQLASICDESIARSAAAATLTIKDMEVERKVLRQMHYHRNPAVRPIATMLSKLCDIDDRRMSSKPLVDNFLSNWQQNVVFMRPLLNSRPKFCFAVLQKMAQSPENQLSSYVYHSLGEHGLAQKTFKPEQVRQLYTTLAMNPMFVIRTLDVHKSMDSLSEPIAKAFAGHPGLLYDLAQQLQRTNTLEQHQLSAALRAIASGE